MRRAPSTAQNILIFDVETTGTDRRRDQVIELCVQFGLGDDAAHKTWRIRPSVPISPGAQAVHGITMDELKGCPRFAFYADRIREMMETADVLIGYNVGFDIDLLQGEYDRLCQPRIDLSRVTVVDAFRLWQRCEPRSLQHAHRRFVGDSFGEAHSATADVAATSRVLTGMLDAFGLADHDWGDIASVCDPERQSWVGPSRHVRWSDGAVPVIGFGRHTGTPVHVLARSPDADYLRWILERDFPHHVREICRQALELTEPRFLRWIAQTFGADPHALPRGEPAAAGAAP